MDQAEYTRKALKELPEKIKRNSKQLLEYLRKLRNKNPKKLDYIFARIHNQVFEKFDCLACANCCRKLGPKFLVRDIDRISRFLSVHPKTFRLQYLEVDEDNDYILQKLPCRFLCDDNSCFIYNERPKACAEYPYTDSRNMRGKLMLTHRNIATCPAVLEIVEKVKSEIPL
jgi:uncharacterized protein